MGNSDHGTTYNEGRRGRWGTPTMALHNEGRRGRWGTPTMAQHNEGRRGRWGTPTMALHMYRKPKSVSHPLCFRIVWDTTLLCRGTSLIRNSPPPQDPPRTLGIVLL